MNQLLRPLCEEFRLDYHDITHIDEVEMLYIYKVLSEQLNTEELRVIVKEITALRKELRAGGRTRSLYPIFRYLQSQHMKQFGNYDFDTLRPPQSSFYDSF